MPAARKTRKADRFVSATLTCCRSFTICFGHQQAPKCGHGNSAKRYIVHRIHPVAQFIGDKRQSETSSVNGYALTVSILKTYAKLQGGFGGKLTMTPSALCDHWRFGSDPRSPILAIFPEKCGEFEAIDLITIFPSCGHASAIA